MPNVIDASGKVLRQEAAPAVFSGDTTTKGNAIFRAVHREMANERSGTHKTKKRDEVSGGGKKPWKQKGTGRARQGSTRSPQWRHGGVVFGPQPRSYVISLNKKERRAALGAALRDRFNADVVTLLDASNLEISKTKALATLLFGSPKAARDGEKTLVVFAPAERATIGQGLIRAGGNLAAVAITGTDALDVRDVVGAKRVVLTTAAYETLVGAFTPETK